MPRALKPYLIETMNLWEVGIVVEIFFNRNSKVFTADVGGETLRANSLSEIQADVLRVANERAVMTWMAVIHVAVLLGYRGLTGVSIRFDRFHYAVLPNGRVRRIEWDRLGQEELALPLAQDFNWHSDDGPFAPPCHRRGHSFEAEAHDYYLPYRDETWNGLGELAGLLTQLSERVTQLVSTSEGQNRIAQVGQGAFLALLTAGKEVTL